MKSTKKKLANKAKIIKSSFSGKKLTQYSGLNTVGKFLNSEDLIDLITRTFPSSEHNATKFGINQILLSIFMASICGINRLSKISVFTHDGLVGILLKLEKGINQNALSKGIKTLGQAGARKLEEVLLSKNAAWLAQSQLSSITLDADSTVKSVCGHQQGAAKGFNTTKKGAKSYHPILLFVTDIKLLYHSWFRTGSAYTSNGICEFLLEVQATLPQNIKKVFFRADSGFFSGKLFDLLESTEFDWEYLVKVKLKNLTKLLKSQKWVAVESLKDIAICDFEYKAKVWTKARTFRAIRSVKEYIEVDFLGVKQRIPVYQYACYASNLKVDAVELHELYKQRSTSETWIEQVKGQVMAGSTLTNDFWANDILWQLSVLAYNVSVMMRMGHKTFKRQEHRTFIEWFITLPGRIVSSGRVIEIKMYKHHYYQKQWEELDKIISNAA